MKDVSASIREGILNFKATLQQEQEAFREGVHSFMIFSIFFVEGSL